MTDEGQEFPYTLQKSQPPQGSSYTDFSRYSGRQVDPGSYPKHNSEARIRDMA